MKQMDICKHCKKRDNCEGFVERTSGSFRHVYFCPKFVNDNGAPFSNADRIRSMSDEELAMNMMCPNENGLGDIECDKSDNCNCYECLLKWLQSEVEE